MSRTPSRVACAARNGSARVAARTRPARRDQQPVAGRRRRRPYRHRAEPGPALRHRDSGTRDRRHRRGHRACCPGRDYRIRAGPGQQHREDCRTSSARAANRRSHPRTVDAGRPSLTAIVRCPAPAAAASSAAPITAPSSARRDRHDAGRARRRAALGTVTGAEPARHPARPGPAPAAAGHAPTRPVPRRIRAGQLPARQLPLDQCPVTVYR